MATRGRSYLPLRVKMGLVFIRLFLLFTLIPLVALYLLIRVGTYIGALPTVAIVIATAWPVVCWPETRDWLR